MRHQRISQEESYLCRCSTTIPVEQETMKKNVWQMLDSYLCIQKKIWKRILVIHKFWQEVVLYQWRQSTRSMGHYGWKDVVCNSESGCPIFRATSPLSRGRLKSKGHRKLSIHYAADLETIETIFCIIVSANQLSLCRAIAERCEEYEPFMKERRNPFWWAIKFLTCAKCE